MRFSSDTLKRTPSFSPIVCASVIIAAASARVGGWRQTSSSVACVSALIGLKLRLPHSLSQISDADIADDRCLEAGLAKQFGQGAQPRRIGAVGLAEGETVALDLLDHTGCNDFTGWINDASDDALGRKMCRDDTTGINALQLSALVRTAMFVEVPPRNSVLCRDDGRIRPDCCREFSGNRRDLVRLHAENENVLRTEVNESIRRGQLLHGFRTILGDEFHAGRTHRLQIGAANHDADLGPDRCQFHGQKTADRAGADHTDSHCLCPSVAGSTRFIIKLIVLI